MRASAARLSAASASSLTLFAASPAASSPLSSAVCAASETSLKAWTCNSHKATVLTCLCWDGSRYKCSLSSANLPTLRHASCGL